MKKSLERKLAKASDKMDKELYIKFKKLQEEDTNKIAVFFKNIRYILGIVCAYIATIALLSCICMVICNDLGWWDINGSVYYYCGGTGLISLGIGLLCVVEYPRRYLPRSLIHPFIRCIPKDWKGISTIDKVCIIGRCILFIVMGIAGIVVTM